jgi:hypothetical protein
MRTQIRTYVFCLKLGVALFPSFFLLDYFVYPDDKYALLMIRFGITLYLAIVLFSIGRMKEKYNFPILLLSTFLIAFSISLMCFITGDGFASPYYAGLLQVIIVTMLFFKISPKKYTLLIMAIIVQHFILLSFIPWESSDLVINILALGIFALVAVLGHNFIYDLAQENQTLKGFLPICASCKKIRDDQGYWNQIESYIKKHSQAEFSHSICPDCAEKLYPGIDLYDDAKDTNQGPIR